MANRFHLYVKPVIEGYFLKVDLEKEIERFNHFLVEKKISSYDQIEWSIFPLSKPFYRSNINVQYGKRYPPEEPLWKVIKDRTDKGLTNRRFLPADNRKILISEIKKIQTQNIEIKP